MSSCVFRERACVRQLLVSTEINAHIIEMISSFVPGTKF